MPEILEYYKGAAIYEAEAFNKEDGDKMGVKLIARAKLTSPKNIKVDFTEEAINQDKAREKMHQRIDRYLDHHGFQTFEHDDK